VQVADAQFVPSQLYAVALLQFALSVAVEPAVTTAGDAVAVQEGPTAAEPPQEMGAERAPTLEPAPSVTITP
jgi:hypothetical protein